MPTGKYDVFISYRRKTGVDDARLLQQALKARGYNVFFDYDSLRDGQFDERIFEAIDNAPIFILMLSEGALDNCVDEGDWVRMEIEHAIQRMRTIVPVSTAIQSWAFPTNLPDCLQVITKTQISELNKTSLFEESVDRIVKDRFSVDNTIKGYWDLALYDKCVAFARKAFAYESGAMPHGFEIGSDIVEVTRKNASMNMDIKTGPQSIVAIWNCALWNHGLYGFALTVDGVYVRNKGRPPVFISWKDLKNCSIVDRDRYFIMAERGFAFNDQKSCSCTHVVDNDMDFLEGQKISQGVMEFAQWILTQSY